MIKFKIYQDRIVLIKDFDEFVIKLEEVKEVNKKLRKWRTNCHLSKVGKLRVTENKRSGGGK